MDRPMPQWRGLLLALLLLPLAGCAGSALSRSEQAKNAGRVYVITDGSGALGRELALTLARQGARLVLAGPDGTALERLAAELGDRGSRPLARVTEVSDPAQVEALMDAALARFGRVDVWINNAGAGVIGSFDNVPLQDHVRVVDVNLKGVIVGSHVALQQFKRQGHGTLVNLGALEGVVPLPYQASYAASKYAVLGLGRALNEELRLGGYRHVAVATVLPWAGLPDGQTANYSGHRPRQAWPDPLADTVNTVLHAALAPREEMPVSWKGRLVYGAHHLMPDLTERLGANLYHWVQMERAPPAPPTTRPRQRPWPAAAIAQPPPAGPAAP